MNPLRIHSASSGLWSRFQERESSPVIAAPPHFSPCQRLAVTHCGAPATGLVGRGWKKCTCPPRLEINSSNTTWVCVMIPPRSDTQLLRASCVPKTGQKLGERCWVRCPWFWERAARREGSLQHVNLY